MFGVTGLKILVRVVTHYFFNYYFFQKKCFSIFYDVRSFPISIVPSFLPIKRHETELKWIKFLQSPFALSVNDNIYHEGNISKMPDFDFFFCFGM